MVKKTNAMILILLALLLAIGGCSALPSNQVKSAPVTQINVSEEKQEKLAGDPVNLKIATLTQGGAWYVYGATMAELWRKSLPEGSVIDVLPYAGGIGNVELVANKEAELALSFTVTNKWASEGSVTYKQKYDSLRALAGKLDEYFVGIVWRKDFAEKYGLTSIKDLKEKKVPVRLMAINVGSLGEFATRQVLEQYGLTYDEIKQNGGSVTHTTFDVIQTAFQDGQADMFIQVITKGHQAVSEIALTTPVTLVSLEDEIVEKLKTYGYQAATLPAGSFKGQDQPVNTIGLTTVLIVNEDFPEDLAYHLTKALAENKPALEAGHKALSVFQPETAWQADNLGIPLHPGAEKYYKEKGWMK
ncbi:TAXI family TRAP transporter solute-binding subunit [Brevibacillus marinus]|uniref:TAXI family TRAP transporter solute-binding subunit n=1 Tax=Brevibacillus marinus TaxID=2496837 RepID=UPI000F816141|nr:TAXI family TRAP transporter solute-binding subunit [Brevibacillus marinus]